MAQKMKPSHSDFRALCRQLYKGARLGVDVVASLLPQLRGSQPEQLVLSTICNITLRFSQEEEMKRVRMAKS